MKKRAEKGSIGQSFDEFLAEQGRLEESTNQAVKRVIAFQLATAIEELQMSKSMLARKLHTSPEASESQAT